MISLKSRIVSLMRPLEMRIHREKRNRESGINKRTTMFGKKIRKTSKQGMTRERKPIRSGRKKLGSVSLKWDRRRMKNMSKWPRIVG